MAAILEIQNNHENDNCSNVNTHTDVLILCVMNAVKHKSANNEPDYLLNQPDRLDR